MTGEASKCHGGTREAETEREREMEGETDRETKRKQKQRGKDRTEPTKPYGSTERRDVIGLR